MFLLYSALSTLSEFVCSQFRNSCLKLATLVVSVRSVCSMHILSDHLDCVNNSECERVDVDVGACAGAGAGVGVVGCGGRVGAHSAANLKHEF